MNTNDAQLTAPTVWGIFVGEQGYELPAFSSKNGLFPPVPGTEGYVAIGWAKVGDMRMYENREDKFFENFKILYRNSYKDEGSFTKAANTVWNFAYKIKEGDYIVSPSQTGGYLLVGQVVGKYQGDFDLSRAVRPMSRDDLMHLRRVKWLCAIPNNDPLRQQIPSIGLATLCNPKITVNHLLSVINQALSASTGTGVTPIHATSRDIGDQVLWSNGT